MQGIEWALVLPAAILAAFGLLGLLLAPFFRGANAILAGSALAGVVLAGVATLRLWGPAGAPGGLETAAGMVLLDRFGILFSLIVLAIALLCVLLSPRFLEREEAEVGEFYALMLFAVCGMVVMVNTRHLMTILVGLEIFSLCLYVLCGLTRYRAASIESALKYDNVTGPNPSLACADCHTLNTASTHVNGRVDLRTRWDNAASTTKTLTQVCDPCHGGGVLTAKANWDASTPVDCLTCHGPTAAYSYANGTGRVAPNMAGDNSTYGSYARGHNRPAASGVYPVTGNAAANLTCDRCHKY